MTLLNHDSVLTKFMLCINDNEYVSNGSCDTLIQGVFSHCHISKVCLAKVQFEYKD